MKRLLYKYYSPNALDDKFIGTLVNQQFWFGSNKILNDPYDLIGANGFFGTYIGRKILQYIKEKGGNVESLRRQMCQFASCSFSRVSSERLMWAHYANSYKGFCIAYSVDKNTPLHTVVYVDKYPIQGSLLGTNIDLNITAILDQWILSPKVDVLKELVYYLASIKSQEWGYEQEERLIEIISSSSNGDSFPWNNYNTNVHSIIFGSYFSHSNMGYKMSNILFKWRVKKNQLFEIRTNALENFEINVVPLANRVKNQYYAQLP